MVVGMTLIIVTFAVTVAAIALNVITQIAASRERKQ
jgi:hypothetical protein